MANYVDVGTQTKWAGLMQRETVRPQTLLSPPPDTSTPPDDMLTEKSQFMYGGIVPSIASPELHQDDQTTPTASSSLLERRRNRAGLDARIDLPSASDALNDEVTYSPPPSNALLSPIPEANKRHAGHTPLIPRSLSPEREPALAGEQPNAQQTADDGNATPDADQGLKGALTLPTNPVDGAQEDHIGLETLDQVLNKIAKQQKILRGEFDDEPEKEPKEKPRMDSVEVGEDDLPLSRKGSADSRRSNTEEVDGVILKSPRSNFGAPLGSL